METTLGAMALLSHQCIFTLLMTHTILVPHADTEKFSRNALEMTTVHTAWDGMTLSGAFKM